jgi:hypothetical protein
MSYGADERRKKTEPQKSAKGASEDIIDGRQLHLS